MEGFPPGGCFLALVALRFLALVALRFLALVVLFLFYGQLSGRIYTKITIHAYERDYEY